MSLNTSALATAIQNAMLVNITNPTPQQNSEISTLANSISSAMETFVLGLDITYTAGLTSTTGPVAGTFGNTLS